jgi:hypothetical protein
LQELCNRRRVFQIKLDPGPVAIQNITVATIPKPACISRAFNPDHPRSVIGEHHAGKRSRSDPGQLDYRHPIQNTGHAAIL